MPTIRTEWKGHEIVVEEPEEATTRAAAQQAPTLEIDGVPVEVLEVSGGGYVAADVAFAPQPTLVDLGKLVVDARWG